MRVDLDVLMSALHCVQMRCDPNQRGPTSEQASQPRAIVRVDHCGEFSTFALGAQTKLLSDHLDRPSQGRPNAMASKYFGERIELLIRHRGSMLVPL
jgi:hypothetical protein